MKKQVQLGLVVEGNSTASAILRLPKFAEELGPVKSATLRVARRLSNMLRAGYAVSEYEELQAARLILLRVPDSAVPRIVSELSSAELVFKNLSFALCESWLMLDVLEPLRTRGSSVATFVGAPSIRRDWFIVEGQPTAVRQVRRFLERHEAKSAEIRPNTKPLYFAAELLATVLPIPLFLAAQHALRASGISGNPLSALLDEMAQKMFQDLLKGARITWGGPLTECSPETAGAYFENLRRGHPQTAQLLEEQLEWAWARMPKHKSLERPITGGGPSYA
jgi:predicted short-subunit dehydrogenase-like oxidoreductase (DUF2520 family)